MLSEFSPGYLSYAISPQAYVCHPFTAHVVMYIASTDTGDVLFSGIPSALCELLMDLVSTGYLTLLARILNAVRTPVLSAANLNCCVIGSVFMTR